MTSRTNIGVFKLSPEAILPTRGSKRSVGYDLYACLPGADDVVTIPDGGYQTVPTGIALVAPLGCYYQIHSRSGMAAKNGVAVLNGPGIIDPDYTGEIKVILHNMSVRHYDIKHGDRIAQFVLTRAIILDLEEVDELPKTERGDGGLGSTGQ